MQGSACPALPAGGVQPGLVTAGLGSGSSGQAGSGCGTWAVGAVHGEGEVFLTLPHVAVLSHSFAPRPSPDRALKEGSEHVSGRRRDLIYPRL